MMHCSTWPGWSVVTRTSCSNAWRARDESTWLRWRWGCWSSLKQAALYRRRVNASLRCCWQSIATCAVPPKLWLPFSLSWWVGTIRKTLCYKKRVLIWFQNGTCSLHREQTRLNVLLDLGCTNSNIMEAAVASSILEFPWWGRGSLSDLSGTAFGEVHLTRVCFKLQCILDLFITLYCVIRDSQSKSTFHFHIHTLYMRSFQAFGMLYHGLFSTHSIWCSWDCTWCDACCVVFLPCYGVTTLDPFRWPNIELLQYGCNNYVATTSILNTSVPDVAKRSKQLKKMPDIWKFESK